MPSRSQTARSALVRWLQALSPARWRWALRCATLAWAMALAGVLPLACLAYHTAQRDAARSAYARLQLVRNAKQAEILAWYQRHLTAISQLATAGDARALYLALHDWAQQQGVKPDAAFPVNAPGYKPLRDTGTALRNFVDMGGYRGLFLIDAKSGQVMFTAPDDVDNGVNLAQEPYKRTGVAECWRRCKDVTSIDPRDGLCITDISHYPPGNTVWANQFVGIPLWHERPPLAILVLQLDVAELDRIVASGMGLGREGQAYLAGSDLLLRTTTRRMQLRQAPGVVLKTTVPAPPVNTALAYDWSWPSGTTTGGTRYTPTLAGQPGWAASTALFPDSEMTWRAWPNQYDAFWMAKIEINAPRWALVVEQPRAEALAPVRKALVQICGLAALVLLGAWQVAWSFSLKLEARILAANRELTQTDEDA